MDVLLFKYLLSGLATGGIYACLALSVVMIYKTIGHLNFAQGEMATLSTYFAWQLMMWGLPIWIAFIFAIMLSFAFAYGLERCVFKRITNASNLAHIVVFVGLFLLINGIMGFVWTFTVKPFPSAFGNQFLLLDEIVGSHQLGMLVVVVAVLAALTVFFQRTRMGLAMRAIASNARSAKLVGVRVRHLTAVGWGLSAAIGAVAGILIAPLVFLEPNMMLSIVVPAFAGAILGGLTSPIGAVLGGLLIGVIESLIAAYIPVVGIELKLPIVLCIIIAVLVVKPSGLLGTRFTQRV